MRTAEDETPTASWLEILVDLIASASLVQLASLLSTSLTVERALLCVACLAPVWVGWSGFTFFSNRYRVDDLAHRALVLIQVVGLGAMGVSAREVLLGRPEVFAVAASAVQLALAASYLRAAVQVPRLQAFAGTWALGFFVSAGLFAMSAALGTHAAAAVWVGVVVLLFGGLLALPMNREAERDHRLDQVHLSRRFGLFVLVLLGSSFVKVQAQLSSFDTDMRTLWRGLFQLLVTLSLWWVYFDDVAGRKLREGSGIGYVWRLAHLPLTTAVALVGVGVALTSATSSGPAPSGARWLLATSLAVALVSVAIIDSYTERYEAALSDRARIAVRLSSAMLVLVLAQAGAGMSATWFMVAVGALCVGQIVFDMLAVPLEAGVLDDARPVAEVDRQNRQDGAAAKGGDLERTIRVGAAGRSGRDLYFFLMEGSWWRVLGAFGVIYALINVLFAGLYQLEDGSIAGTDGQSWSDAFFFSVQTLTSLGYGVLSPATPWANALVATEAAVGILYGAVAAGVAFAKVSRPRSSVLFSDVLVITRHHGVDHLMLRVANARGNDVVGASMSVAVLMDDISPEGHHFRRLHDLRLVRDVTPLFRLSWTAMHPIDEHSPLADDEVWDRVFGFIVTMTGHDSTYSQQIYDRRLYQASDLRHGHRFVDVISQTEDGRMVLNLDRFHDTEEDAP